MIRAALAAFLTTGPAFAYVESWPALYDVVNVAEDDVLNVREDPNASSYVFGRLAPGAVVEVIDQNPEGTWALVNSGEAAGWVSTRHLRRLGAQLDGDYPEITVCGGTEPFWDLTRKDGNITFESFSYDSPPVTESLLWETTSIGNRHRYAFRTPNMIGFISREYCHDGMSDRAFGLEINLILDEEGYHMNGCCSILPREE